MLQELQYPFDAGMISKKRRRLKRELLALDVPRLAKNIAVLGGSTTHDICEMLELFLLDAGIAPAFYESEFGQYWQDAMFENPALQAFAPDIIFIHTTARNIQNRPTLRQPADEIEQMLQEEFARFEHMWQALAARYRCPVIQNNFERPAVRLLGNKDVSDIHGLSHFAARLNAKFYEYAATHEPFYIHDIDYLAAECGLSRFAAADSWHMYKMCPAPAAVPAFAANLAHIIRSIYGGNKKVVALDLDNTLWGGVVGDDGAAGLAIGHETAMGEVYSEFQGYIKAHKDLGVLLAVASKNEEENALAGLRHPEGTLRPEDFAALRANWEPKHQNIADMANELNLGTDSFVFVDDNPVERELVRGSGLGVAVPELADVQGYMDVLDKNGWFELTAFSEDDLQRGEMYAQNTRRTAQQGSFASYDAFLQSLGMVAQIRPFEALYLPRIAQLTNKSNQFNLTTRRCTESELAAMAQDETCLTLYGKLADKFGDNGLVSVVAGHCDKEQVLHIDLWLMSCRVLKRGMESAMMNVFMRQAMQMGAMQVLGYYYQTEKNGMVRDFFAQFGFTKQEEAPNGDSVWQMDVESYVQQKTAIAMEGDEHGQTTDF